MLCLLLRQSRRVILFDCGDLRSLRKGVLRRVSDLLITHAHLDHLGDFTCLLRARMGLHGGEVRVWGPPPIREQIGSLLSGYSWNLLGDFPLSFLVSELTERGLVERMRYEARPGGFQEERLEPGRRDDLGLVHEQGGMRLRAALLDHGIPCVAYAVEEGLHAVPDPVALQERGLRPGPWISHLRQLIAQGSPDSAELRLPQGVHTLGELRGVLRRVEPGKRVVWAVDLAYTENNRAALRTIARRAELLYMEAAFLHREVARAERSHHLSAKQAGELARSLQVKRLVPIHISPRHHHCLEEVRAEAMRAFRGESCHPMTAASQQIRSSLR